MIGSGCLGLFNKKRKKRGENVLPGLLNLLSQIWVKQKIKKKRNNKIKYDVVQDIHNCLERGENENMIKRRLADYILVS